MSQGKSESKRRRSVLWNFFTQLDDSLASCDLCRHKLSYKTTTNNLRKHVKRKHPSIDEEISCAIADSKRLRQEKDNNMYLEVYDAPNHSDYVSDVKMSPDALSTLVTSLDTSAEHSEVTPLTPSAAITVVQTDEKKNSVKSSSPPHTIHRLKSGKYNSKLMQLFIKDFQPYRIVEDPGFQGFVSFLNPTYQLPSKSFISKTAIPELYKKCLNTTKDLIKMGDIFCITLEMWTTMNSDSFISITSHFVNEQFKLTSLLLDCCTITFPRNSENYAYEIKKIVSEWGIEEKIQFVVSKNDNDIQNAVSDILGYEHFNCFADTMNTIVREAISSRELCGVIEKISGLVEYIKRNTLIYEKLVSHQREAGDSNFSLKQVSDMQCFRAIYFMLDKFIKLESAIRDLLEEIDDIDSLSDDEWKISSQLWQVLRPFESVMITISSEKYCPASIVIPVVNGLHSVCDSLEKKPFLPPISKAVADVKEAIGNHLGNIEMSPTLSVCSFLDPRFKDIAFSDKELADHAKEVVISALTSSVDEKADISSSSHHEEVVEEELTVWHVFDQAVSENRVKSDSKTKETEVEDSELSVWSTFDNTVALTKPKATATCQALVEVQRYLDAELLPRQENPLEWWKENKQSYPQLSMLARSQLCAVSTSIPCERIFTKSGMHLMERRNRLSERNTKLLVFLNANL